MQKREKGEDDDKKTENTKIAINRDNCLLL